MGDTAATLFDIDRGQARAETDANLLDRFMGAHNDDRPLILVDNTRITAATEDAAQSEDSHDTLINDPYAVTTRKLFYEKLQDGKWGEAIDMLAKRLENADEDYARELLTEFRDEFEALGLQDAADQLTAILAFNDINAGFAFFSNNAGHNYTEKAYTAEHPVAAYG